MRTFFGRGLESVDVVGGLGSVTVIDGLGSVTVIDGLGSVAVIDGLGSVTVIDGLGSVAVIDGLGAWFEVGEHGSCSIRVERDPSSWVLGERDRGSTSLGGLL